MWSKLVTGSPAHQPQQEHIPLVSSGSTPVTRVDSVFSLCGSESTDQRYEVGYIEPLTFKFHVENRTYVKRLDYAVFAHWENVTALLEELESDGTVIQGLWDVGENMAICSGDWDARVRPGLEVDVVCREPKVWRKHSRRVSDDEEDEADQELERGDNPLLKRHWWFARWRRKVEQDFLASGNAAREPSRRMLLLGILSMATFLGVVLVLCII
jgi:hypothetical protein